LNPAPESQPGTPSREYGLDWLRVFAFAILILYHSGMAFVPWEWHLKNPEHSRVLEALMLLCNRWRIPLLFFISGAGVAFSLRRRPWGTFAGERLRRLLLPLVVGILVVVPPQIYLERLSQGAQFSYLEFYRTVFDGVPYPKGSFSWHHLWFVVYILVFSLVGIPAFAALRSDTGRRTLAAMVRLFERHPASLYLIGLPSLLVAVTLGPHWPTTHNLVADWANLTGSFVTFLWGFIAVVSPGFLDHLTRRRREFLVGGLICAAVFFAARETGITRDWTPLARLWFWNVVNDYYGLTWIFGLIAYARAHITRPSPWLTYATEAVYPFYIIHQTLTVALVYAVIPWSTGVWPKFTTVALGTFLGSWLFFEVIRRTPPLRPLFGLRFRTRPIPAPPPS
jgi:glucan biosynthesis protein C